jgi:hypothetical protein
MTKTVQKSEKWKYKELSDLDKTNIKMATACYTKATKQREKTPKYSIDVARDIIPYVVDEDNKWAGVEKNKVTQNPKIAAYKQFADLVRSTLRSQAQLDKYLNLVDQRDREADQPDEEEESSIMEVPESDDEGS